MTENDPHICYICLQPHNESFRPCDNELCTARVHQACLKQQYGTFAKECGNCRNPIIINKNKIFNNEQCCITYLKIFYMMFMFLFGSASIVFLAIGKTINYDFSSSPKCFNCNVADIIFIFFWLTPFILMFWQFPERFCGTCWCCCNQWEYDIFQYITNRKIKYKYYITMLIMYFISVLLVFVSHAIGALVLKVMYDIDEFFTMRTSFAGIMVYYIIIGAGLVILSLFSLGKYIYGMTHENFTNEVLEFGVVVK